MIEIDKTELQEIIEDGDWCMESFHRFSSKMSKRILAYLKTLPTGKLYTEAEMQEKLGYVEGLYTPEELDKAVKAEREKWITYILKVKPNEDCAKEIRSRKA